MAAQLHAIVEDAYNRDRVISLSAIQDKVTTASSMQGDVQRANARSNLIASSGAGNVRAIGKLAKGCTERFIVTPRLVRSKVCCCPAQDGGKIAICQVAESNSPSPAGHEAQSPALAMARSEASLR